MIACCRHSF